MKEARCIATRVDCGGEGLYGLGEGQWGYICAGEEKEGWKGWRGRGKVDERGEMGRRICGMLRRRRSEMGALPVV